MNKRFDSKAAFTIQKSTPQLKRDFSNLDALPLSSGFFLYRLVILDELNDYDKQKTPEIPKSLEEYINHLAKTGETLFPWLKIRGVLRHKLELVIANFKEICPTENLPPCPNVEPFHFETVRDKILEQFDSFTCAPFTIQRLCELLCAPRKHYKRTDKFMRGIEKNLLVVSTVDPEQRKRSESVSSSQTLVNGVVEINVGSSRPLVTFGAKNDQRPASAASDTASVSDADSGISDTEDEEKPAAGKQPESMKAPEEVETKETNGAAEIEEAKPLAATESAPVIESQVTAEEPTRSSEVVEAAPPPPPPPACNEEEKDKVEAPPVSEEESGRSIDVESVASEEKPVEMKEVVAPTKEEERIVPDSEIPPASVETPSEVLETPVSDKKRPLEKAEGEDDDDDREHSPDAKQPRIFSPDKVVEDNTVPEPSESSSQVAEQEEQVTTLPQEAEKTAETTPPQPESQ
uniref:EOG090X0BWU n=1 Tax=Ceriodaphnia reticulata TaxID=302197 RepID=A0A4Y7M0E0_9CRUS|nr:EOG090X0BWU [Ceriodaphnia reticulata]SVE73153.1 EOG090X0BWU [Ceriodaphnia reticulata]